MESVIDKSPVDWKKCVDYGRKIGVYPKQYYYPNIPFDACAWFVLLSARGMCKTTAYVLLGMIANKLYGTRIEYARRTSEMILPKKMRSFFDTIRQLEYIQKITDNRWNDIYYYGGYWYYQNVDENGNTIEKCHEPVMHCFGLNDNFKMKSTYASPSGDLIILDEFIDDSIYQDDFILLNDIASTIFRQRLGCKIILLSNTINPRSAWFIDLGISRAIQKMKTGDRTIENVDRGRVYVEIMAKQQTKKKSKVNDEYFFFNNPKLASITGSTEWNTITYPRFNNYDSNGKKIKYDIINNSVHIKVQEFYCKLYLVNHPIHGTCVLCIDEEKVNIYDDDIVLVTDTPQQKNEYYVKQFKDLFKVYFQLLYQVKKWYYSTNTAGLTVKSFIESI